MTEDRNLYFKEFLVIVFIDKILQIIKVFYGSYLILCDLLENESRQWRNVCQQLREVSDPEISQILIEEIDTIALTNS